MKISLPGVGQEKVASCPISNEVAQTVVIQNIAEVNPDFASQKIWFFGKESGGRFSAPDNIAADVSGVFSRRYVAREGRADFWHRGTAGRRPRLLAERLDERRMATRGMATSAKTIPQPNPH
jgi:hypothetical protein